MAELPLTERTRTLTPEMLRRELERAAWRRALAKRIYIQHLDEAMERIMGRAWRAE
jgi:hypothetical protein